VSAEVVVPSSDLTADISLLEASGFQLSTIFPADEPRVAELSGHGLAVRLDMLATSGAPTLRIPDLESMVELSGGATLIAADTEFAMPALDDETVFTSGGEWGDGRAGMHYRDLIPKRHGGRVIASHIRIAEPGPVPDYVHHHDIRFQMIFCRSGRVQVLYEDQGDAFWMEAGDCVLQPPNIRHRVLASEDGCEVVEIASPAEHPTYVEHDITLPTGQVAPDRDFGGQRFSFDRAPDLPWEEVPVGWEQRLTRIGNATNGLALVRVVRPQAESVLLSGVNHGDLCLLFVLDGTATVLADGLSQVVTRDDSVAIKSGDTWNIENASVGFRCLHVELAGSDT